MWPKRVPAKSPHFPLCVCSSSNIIHKTQIFGVFIYADLGSWYCHCRVSLVLIAEPIAFDFAGGWPAQNLLNHIMLMEYLYTRSESYPPKVLLLKIKAWNVIQIYKSLLIRCHISARTLFRP